MAKENHTYQIIFAILLIAVIAFAGLYFTKSAPQEINEQTCSDFINECPEEKSILDAQIYDWAINEDNSSEMFFDYWLYNYGNVEARNIKVRCDLYEDDLIIKATSVIDNFGNLASRSSAFGEVLTPDVSKSNEFYTALCYVESCDNCEILYKRIPDLI